VHHAPLIQGEQTRPATHGVGTVGRRAHEAPRSGSTP